jgi:nucleoside 2-deoxyribosyltransferase
MSEETRSPVEALGRLPLPFEPSDAEKVWLNEMLRRWTTNERVDPRQMLVRLRDKLPAGFKPSDVSPVYSNGDIITAMGVYAVDHSSSVLLDADRVIRAIRDLIVKDHSIVSIEASPIAKSLGLEPRYVSRLFWLVGTLGDFWSSGGGTADEGLATIDIKREGNVAEFLGYKDIESQVWRQIERRLEHQDGPISVELLGERERAPTISDTAFVVMPIDKRNPELEDVLNGIKEVCGRFGVRAIRSDEVEHNERITDVILEHIERCEYIVADLTAERPNVYYEVGVAHALKKKPVLVGKAGTKLHFDLSVHNVIEYANVTELKKRLHDRFEAMLGRGPKASTGVVDTAVVTRRPST